MSQNHQTLEICRFVYHKTSRNNCRAYYCVRLESYLDEVDSIIYELLSVRAYSFVRFRRLDVTKTAWFDKHGNIIVRYTRRKNG